MARTLAAFPAAVMIGLTPFGHELGGAAQPPRRSVSSVSERDDLVLEHQDEEDEPGRDAGQNDRHQQKLEGEEDDDDVAEALQRRLIGPAQLIETVADTTTISPRTRMASAAHHFHLLVPAPFSSRPTHISRSDRDAISC